MIWSTAFLLPSPAFADSVAGRVVPSESADRITGLAWVTDDPTLEFGNSPEPAPAASGSPEAQVPAPRTVSITAILDGKYKRTGWNLIFEDKRISTTPDGDFQLRVPVALGIRWIEVVAVGPDGELEREKLGIVIEDQIEFNKKFLTGKSYAVSFSLGYTTISYKQNEVPAISESAVTAKAQFLYFLVPGQWDLGGSIFTNVFAMAPTPDISTIKFLGINARVGHTLPYLSDPWRLSLMMGFYYNTMSVNPQLFGYKNVFGPQVFPLLMRKFKRKDSAIAYAKFSPITSGFSPLSPSNRELAAGAGWIHILPSGHTITLNVDTSNLQLTEQDVSSSTLTLSLGFGF